MKIRTLLTFCLCTSALLVPTLSHAHFLWASLDPSGKTVSLGFQEVPSQTPLPLGDRMSLVKAWLPAGTALPLKADGNWFRASISEFSVGASLDYGVIDRSAGGRGIFWLKYYAKGSTTLAASQTRLSLPMELIAAPAQDGKSLVTVLQDGKPAPGAEVVVEDADGKPTFNGKTGSDGTALLPISQGPLEVRALITDKTPGTSGGKAYELTRTYSTLTVQDPNKTSLRQQLRAAFGDLHDVVSHTAFINTVMDGHLTKAQLADHLQQRALIHQEVDRILRKTEVSPLPYHEPQQDVLTLLKADLKSMGSRWPGRSAAWPLTSTFLKDIKSSATTGPYFALGVFYVYYGGITHGGRDIGEMIQKQTNAELTYYEKSDGYDAFAPQVDQITDPKAQAEMIRGALEAYHYIIDVNNLEVFKASGS